MTPSAYRQLQSVARRATRRADEADDLVQDALLAAVAAGRTDFGDSTTLRWMSGVIRNRATFTARTAARRMRRDMRWSSERPPGDGGEEPAVAEVIAGLPQGLKAVAALALTGHNRREIAFLLQLPDTALRRRISDLRRRLAAKGIGLPAGLPGLTLNLQYGRLRDALLPLLIARGGQFASHDPDGHLFIVRLTNHKAAAT